LLLSSSLNKKRTGRDEQITSGNCDILRANIRQNVDLHRGTCEAESMIFRIAAAVLWCSAGVPLFAQGLPPLQVDVKVRVDHGSSTPVRFRSPIEGGGAIVKGRVTNLPNGETTLVSLRFTYRTNADIALDELISQIVISTSDTDGNEFSRVTIDPNTVPLNPNRAPLSYSATLYKPPRGGANVYIARVQVFGNYE
jgi:hypothetical protein